MICDWHWTSFSTLFVIPRLYFLCNPCRLFSCVPVLYSMLQYSFIWLCYFKLYLHFWLWFGFTSHIVANVNIMSADISCTLSAVFSNLISYARYAHSIIQIMLRVSSGAKYHRRYTPPYTMLSPENCLTENYITWTAYYVVNNAVFYLFWGIIVSHSMFYYAPSTPVSVRTTFRRWFNFTR